MYNAISVVCSYITIPQLCSWAERMYSKTYMLHGSLSRRSTTGGRVFRSNLSRFITPMIAVGSCGLSVFCESYLSAQTAASNLPYVSYCLVNFSVLCMNESSSQGHAGRLHHSLRPHCVGRALFAGMGKKCAFSCK
jgi:hypothetical protein